MCNPLSTRMPEPSYLHGALLARGRGTPRRCGSLTRRRFAEIPDWITQDRQSAPLLFEALSWQLRGDPVLVAVPQSTYRVCYAPTEAGRPTPRSCDGSAWTPKRLCQFGLGKGHAPL